MMEEKCQNLDDFRCTTFVRNLSFPSSSSSSGLIGDDYIIGCFPCTWLQVHSWSLRPPRRVPLETKPRCRNRKQRSGHRDVATHKRADGQTNQLVALGRLSETCSSSSSSSSNRLRTSLNNGVQSPTIANARRKRARTSDALS